MAAAVAPFGGEHDEVECVGGLQLEPGGAPRAGVVARVQRLGDQPFLPRRDRPLEEHRGCTRVRCHDAGHTLLGRHRRGEGGEPPGVGLIQQRRAVGVEEVEEEECER